MTSEFDPVARLRRAAWSWFAGERQPESELPRGSSTSDLPSPVPSVPKAPLLPSEPAPEPPLEAVLGPSPEPPALPELDASASSAPSEPEPELLKKTEPKRKPRPRAKRAPAVEAPPSDPLAEFPQLAGLTVEQVREMSDEALLAVEGVGKATLAKIRAAVA